MKAIIFAAGLGTRLKPFTLEHPKALVDVCGKPMLQRVIEKLKAGGVSEIVVNVHHFAGQIIEFIRTHNDFGLKIHISDETGLLLDTGGGILAARDWLYGKEPFIVHNSDILTDFPVRQMWNRHLLYRPVATLLAGDRSTSRYLLFDKDEKMRGWINVDTQQIRPAAISDEINMFGKRAFGGVHVMSPSIFAHLEQYNAGHRHQGSPEIVPFSIMDFYISACSHIDIRGFTPDGQYQWFDIGKPSSLAVAEATFREP